MAVDDKASAPPTTNDTAGGMPNAMATDPIAKADRPTCNGPSPNTTLRMVDRRSNDSSSPSMKSRKTTPNSASLLRCASSPMVSAETAGT